MPEKYLIVAVIAGLKGYLGKDGQFHLDRSTAQQLPLHAAQRKVRYLQAQVPDAKISTEPVNPPKFHAFSTKDQQKAFAFLDYAFDTEGMEFRISHQNKTYSVFYTANYDKQVVEAVVRNFRQEWGAFQG